MRRRAVDLLVATPIPALLPALSAALVPAVFLALVLTLFPVPGEAQATPPLAAGIDDIDVYCPGAQEDLPDTFNLASHFAWAAADDAPQTPGFVERSCRAWAWARLHASADDAAETQASLGGALVWAGRNAHALRLLLDAFPRLRAARPARPAASATAAAFIAMLYLQRTELDPALRWSQQALDLGAAPGSGLVPHVQLRMQINHLTMLSMSRRHAEVEARSAQLLEQARASLPAMDKEFAALLRVRAISQRRQEKIPEALASTRAEIAFRQSQPGLQPADLAVAQQNLASMLEVQGHYDEALQALRDALRIAEAGGPDIWRNVSAIPESLSRLLLLRGEADQALAAARRAVAMLEDTEIARTARMARPLRHLAQAQLATGAPGTALVSMRRALALLGTTQSPGDQDTEAALHSLHVQLQLVLGDTAQAQVALDGAQARLAALPLAPIERARLQALKAALAQRRGETAQALQALDEADATLAANWPTTHPLRLALRVQACDWAGRDCDGVQAVRDGISAAPLRAHATLALARGPQLDVASRLTLAREAIADAAAASQPDALWQAYATYAQALHRADRNDEAIFFGKLALQTLQGLRDSVQSLGVGSELLFLQDKHAEYRRVADWLLDAGRLPEALEVLRLLKRSEQNDFTERAQPAGPAALGYTSREQQWLQRVQAEAAQGGEQAAEIERLARLEAARRITPEELARLQALRAAPPAQAAAGRARWSRSLEAMPATGAAAAGRPLATAPQLPLPQDAQTLHAYMLAGPDRLSALLVSQRGQRVLHQPVGTAALSRAVAALLDAVRQRSDVVAPAQALYRHLGPLLDEPARAWGARRIVLWLDGPLRYLPLALLHDGRRFLVERYAFRVATPVEAVAAGANAARTAPQPLRVRAWGVTRALGGLPALPGVGDEICGIVDGPLRGIIEAAPAGLDITRCQGVLPGQGDANAQFTEAAWRAAGAADKPGGVVHVGTHFVLRPGNVSQSWLLLGDGSRLMLQTLRQLPLGAPRLLTLSACETAAPVGVDADGREVDGLAGSLLASGARQVLASMWRIDDRATAGVMQRFYTHAARQPTDLSGALQRAQLDAIQRGLSPQVWAAFTLSEPAPR